MSSPGDLDAAAPRERLLQSVAQAIREADRDYLRTNYEKIGAAVLAALDERGYVVVPRRPTTKMLAGAHARLSYGLQEAGGAFAQLYEAMLEAWCEELETMRRIEILNRLLLKAARTGRRR